MPVSPNIQNVGEDLSSDGPENYEIVEKIASGSSSSVFCARCKRGRLKNRLVAFKMVEQSGTATLPSILHQSLYHPSIVSLFSAFSSSSHRFQILELCTGGSLTTFLATHKGEVLNEGESRLVLKPLVDALSYLKRESIVHRNINLENILLTEERRIKLSNFDLATHLPSQDFTMIPSQCIDYVSPEILSHRRYDCSADLWSLGCVAFACLAGKPPFQGSSTNDVLENIVTVRYSFPENLSIPAANFIESLLQIDPARRQSITTISYDPFLISSVPDQVTSHGATMKHEVLPKFSQIPNIAKKAKPIPLPFRAPSSIKESRRLAKGNSSKTSDQEIQNLDLRRLLSDEISLSERRTASDPLSRPSPRDKVPVTLGRAKSETHTPTSINLHLRLSGQRTLTDPEKDIPLSHLNNVEIPEDTRVALNSDDNSDDSELDTPKDCLPIGTARPAPFTTTLLSARTHKTVNGQVTVLPSRSLLVDLREGERRKGNKGSEVLVVTPDGTKVSIYNAPHLSSPCCLAEPIVTYNIDTLPRTYWKQYNDASLLVTRLKQRTPKMVLHGSDIKYTLMANTPQSDIEVIFSEHVKSNTRSKHQSSKARAPPDKSTDTDIHKPKMRLRYSRQAQTLEITEYIVGRQGEEWTKKVLHTPNLDRMQDKFRNLTSLEQESLLRLLDFLRVCEAVEVIEGSADPRKSFHAITGDSSLPKDSLADYTTNRIFSSSQTIGRSLSIDVPPRPRKFSSTLRGQKVEPDIENYAWPTSKQHSHLAGKYSSQLTDAARSIYAPTPTSSCFRDDTIELPSKESLQTRFIPSTGWCIRHNSKISQGGRYKLMFLDGDVLDIDVDEEWAEFTDLNGHKQRHTIRECHQQRALSERMKVFDEFVSVFEADALNQSV